jgi:hypothetical protein
MRFDIARLSQKLMTMDDATWARHVHPWSGWSRVSILPLLALAVWSRIWIGWWAVIPGFIVLLWTWLNPRVFPPPVSVNNWMSMGVLGERIWLSHGKEPALAHHAHVIRNLMVVASAGTVMLLVGLVTLSLTLTLTGLAVTMLSKLWIVDRMVWIYGEARGRSDPAGRD